MGLDYPTAAPWCATAHLGWCLRQAERVGVDRTSVADFCAVPVELIYRFAEGGYASEAETPSGIVTGLRALMEEAVRPIGPALIHEWTTSISWDSRGETIARYINSIPLKIQIKASSVSAIKEQSHA